MIEERHFFYDQGVVGHYEIVLKKSGYSLSALRISIQQDSFYGSGARCMGRADGLSFSSKVDIVLASLSECHSSDDATTLFGIALSLVTGCLFAHFEANGVGALSEERGFPTAITACALLLMTIPLCTLGMESGSAPRLAGVLGIELPVPERFRG